MRYGNVLGNSRTIAIGIALSALLSAFSAAAENAPIAPAATYVTASGRALSTAQLKGHRTMLWLLSTWCGSCAAGLQTMADNAAALKSSGLRVVILRNYRNGGYPGLDIRGFVDRIAPGLVERTGWTLGEASPQLEQAYNRKGYPDIYFLIDAQGRVRVVDGAPSATMDRILRFARGQDR